MNLVLVDNFFSVTGLPNSMSRRRRFMKKKILGTLLSSLMIFTILFNPFFSVAAETAQEVPAAEELPPDGSSEIIEVKFVEGSTFRLREGVLTALQPDDLVGINGVLDTFAVTMIERLFSQPEHEIEAERAELLARTGETLPDLNLWYRVWVQEGSAPDQLITALNALPEVQIAYPAPLPAPPTSIDLSSLLTDPNSPPAIPNYEGSQGYLYTAPGGIDAKYAWGLAGGKGENVQIVDVEYSWNSSHVDLPSISLINGVQYLGFGDDHGTAVQGELVAKKDGVGVSGIAHLATSKFSSPCPNSACSGYNPAGAINAAKTNSVSGDVILIEQQYGVCGTSNYGPLEWIQSVYDAIKVATTAGRIVVEAAGNGSVDLDGTNCNNLFNRSFRDSGAIIVGAGAAPTGSQAARSRLSFSSYGSRVDVQGWGENVYSTGYGDLYTGTGKNQWYTATFAGTSSASPIAAGAAAILSSVAQARGISLTPLQIRSKLVSTGSPQQAAVGFPITQHIGPLPNLKNAINSLVSYIPKPISPSAATPTHKPTYKWSKVPNATNYIIHVYQGTTRIFAKKVLAGAVCDSTTCKIRPNVYLKDGNYKWRVRAIVGGVLRAFSPFKKFNVATNFHYYFNVPSDLKLWHTVVGSWNLNNGWYRSAGVHPFSNSVFHQGLYPTFNYIVRMRRINNPNYANMLYVRGIVYPLALNKYWNSAYRFQYTNNGWFSVWKEENGVFNPVKNWTTTIAINQYGWNLLQVKGKGGNFKFYINGQLVWSGTDTSRGTGKVGIGFEKPALSWQPLLVAGAHMYTNVPTLSNEVDVWAEIGKTNTEWDNPNISPPAP